MKRFSVVFCLVCFGVLCLGTGAVRGEATGSIVGWGTRVLPEKSALENLVAIDAGSHVVGLKSNGTIVAWGRNDYGQCDIPIPNADFVAISVGGEHSLALRSNGTIKAWGRNNDRQCIVPAPNADFVAMSAGGYHNLGLKSDGTIVAWGDSTHGQCDVPAPNADFIVVEAGANFSIGIKSDSTIVAWGDNSGGLCDPPWPNSDIVAVAAGYSHYLRLKSDGTIYARGSNYYGQCNVPTPNADFVAVAAGGYHSLGLKSDGTIVAWGHNGFGQCTVPAPNADFVAVAANQYHSIGFKSDGTIIMWGTENYWGQQVVQSNVDFVAVAAGYAHTLGLQYDETIVAWGATAEGQCDIPAPNADFVGVAGGHAHSLGLKSDGTIVAWGDSSYGQCDAPEPNTDFMAVAAGWNHSLGLKSDGTIVTWGDNTYGQCNVPAPNAGFVAIAAGSGSYGFSLGLKSDGTIVAWGHNGFGQCTVPAPNADFVAVAAGGYHSLGVKSDGTIAAWGHNYSGQCAVPAPNADFVAAAGGSYHSLGLKSDGTIVAWGENYYGQCDVLEPNTDFVAIAANQYHSIGLKSSDAIPGGVWNTNDSGVGSLRQAIINANAAPDTSLIAFAIEGSGPHTIQPLTPLPIITAPVIIDGYTQPGASANTNGDGLGGNAVLQIELDGTLTGDRGLYINAGHSTIRGLVINRFSGPGIDLVSDGNVIEGNYIGTDVTGTQARPNIQGIEVSGSGNIIGGAEPAARNVISGNTTYGVYGYSPYNSLIQGNFIGVSASGASGVGNGSAGVGLLSTSRYNVIDKNVISANGSNGVWVYANTGWGDGNSIRSNYIGTDLTGTLALGNGSDGVSIGLTTTTSGYDNIIGGAPAYANLIANNGGAGVITTLRSNATLRTVVSHNIIHSNNDKGVVITQGNATISQNRIYSNTLLGIDLADNGVTANDAGDSDTGPNGLQNYPVLTAVQPESLIVTGTLNSTGSTQFCLEFFSSQTCDPSAYGEGATFLCDTLVRTKSTGNVSFEVPLHTQIPGGHYITATARPVSGGGTSEFSQCIEFINTTAGTNVSVTPVNETTGETPVDLTFDEVTAAGNTLLEISDVGPAVPGTFVVGDSAMYYHLGTTATFNDSILVCFSYDEAEIPDAEEDLVILHYDTTLAMPGWVDITVSLDTLANIVCGRTATLSPFVLAVPASATGTDPTPEAPTRFALYQNIPNPFNPVTTIRFDLPARAHVRLSVYNVKGQLIRTLIDEQIETGHREVRWNGRDSAGRSVASGIYFYFLQTPALSEAKKMILLR